MYDELEHRTILDRTVNEIANLYLLALPEEYHENQRIDSVLIYIPQAPFGHKTVILPLCLTPLLLLGAFAKHLQKVILSLIIYLRPSVLKEGRNSHWIDFRETSHPIYLLELVDTFQFCDQYLVQSEISIIIDIVKIRRKRIRLCCVEHNTPSFSVFLTIIKNLKSV